MLLRYIALTLVLFACSCAASNAHMVHSSNDGVPIGRIVCSKLSIQAQKMPKYSIVALIPDELKGEQSFLQILDSCAGIIDKKVEYVYSIEESFDVGVARIGASLFPESDNGWVVIVGRFMCPIIDFKSLMATTSCTVN